MTDREVIPGCARMRTKCAKNTSVDLWGQSRGPRELPGVIGPATGLPGCYTLTTRRNEIPAPAAGVTGGGRGEQCFGRCRLEGWCAAASVARREVSSN
jgi:hypothetical protein